MRHPKTSEWLKYPCGQCLACRVKKRSTWTLRNLLESRTAISSSFWTLTLSECGLQTIRDVGPRSMVRAFFDALRKAESRAGNQMPIRYYGCLEFGGQLGRPHFHLLIYNLVTNFRVSSPYRENLPRPRQHIAQWPHGHVDIAEFNNATINYCCDYLTKFISEAEKPQPYRTIRPAIGFYGLKSLAVSVANTHTILPGRPAFLEVNGRKFPLDQWCRDTFEREFRKAGGRFAPNGGPRARTLDRLSWEAAREALPHVVLAEQKAQERLERLILGKAQKKENAERAATAIYLNRIAAKAATESVALGFTGEE